VTRSEQALDGRDKVARSQSPGTGQTWHQRGSENSITVTLGWKAIFSALPDIRRIRKVSMFMKMTHGKKQTVYS